MDGEDHTYSLSTANFRISGLIGPLNMKPQPLVDPAAPVLWQLRPPTARHWIIQIITFSKTATAVVPLRESSTCAACSWLLVFRIALSSATAGLSKYSWSAIMFSSTCIRKEEDIR